ncbi:MAG: beta-hydroxyacyl-ACP dehydratase [Spirochaetaceae bacterium]|nr:MAG: beta-hydroxyacyl-ACP dehydratase [Spirochaetaceae bacterium]
MDDIKQLLPHRDPFLYVDRLETVSDEKIVGYRTYTDAEYFFAGHFPQYPVVPGVILVETMAQCGGAGVKALNKIGSDALFFLAAVDKVKFRRQVRPNETVRIEIENLRISAKMIKQAGTAYVGEEIAAEAEWLCLVGTA